MPDIARRRPVPAGLARDEGGFMHAIEAVLAVFLLMYYSQSILRTPVFIRVIQQEEAVRELSDQIMGILASLDNKNLLGEALLSGDFSLLDKTLENVLPKHAGFSYSITYMQPFTVAEPTGTYAWSDWPLTVSMDYPVAVDRSSVNLRDQDGGIVLPLQVDWPWRRVRIDLGHKLTSAWPDFTVPLRMCDLYRDRAGFYSIRGEDEEYMVNCLPVRGPPDLVELEPADVNEDGRLEYPDPGSVRLYLDDWYDARWRYRLRVTTKAVGAAPQANASLTVELAPLIAAQGIPCQYGLDQNSTIIADARGVPMNYTSSAVCRPRGPYESSCDCRIVVNWTSPGGMGYGDVRTFYLYFNTFDVEEPAERCLGFANVARVTYVNCRQGITYPDKSFACLQGRCSIHDCRREPRLKWSFVRGAWESGKYCPRQDRIPGVAALVATYGPVQVYEDRDFVPLPMEVADWRDGRAFEDDVVYNGITLQRRAVREVNHSGIPAWNLRVRVVAFRANRTVELGGEVSGLMPGSCDPERGGILGCVQVVKEVAEEDAAGGRDRPDPTTGTMHIGDLPSALEPVRISKDNRFYLCTSTMHAEHREHHPFEGGDDLDVFTINITVPKIVYDARTGVMRRNYPKSVRLLITLSETYDAEFTPCPTSLGSKEADSPLLDASADSLVVLPTGESLDLVRTWSVTGKPVVAPYPSSYARVLFHLPYVEAPDATNLYPGEVHKELYLYYALGTDKDPPPRPRARPCPETKLYCARDDVFFVRDASEPAPRADLSWLDSIQPGERKRFYSFFRVGTSESPVTGESELSVETRTVCTDCFAESCPARICTNRRDDNNNALIDEAEVRAVSNVTNAAGAWGLTLLPTEVCDVQSSRGGMGACMLDRFVPASVGGDLLMPDQPAFALELPGLVERRILDANRSAAILSAGPVRGVVATTASSGDAVVANLMTFYPKRALWRMAKTVIPRRTVLGEGNLTFSFAGSWTNLTYGPKGATPTGVMLRQTLPTPRVGYDVPFDRSDDWVTYWNTSCGRYVFGWERVPGADERALSTFLRDTAGLEWVEDGAAFTKEARSGNVEVIRTASGWEWAELSLDLDTDEATLRTSSTPPRSLVVKAKGSSHGVYHGWMGACGFTVALADHGALSEARAMPDAITEPSLTLVLNRTAFTAYNATTVRALVEFGLDPSDAGAQLGALQGRPFEAEYTRLVPLSGGTAVPEKTVPPQISTGTAAYVVTTNGRRVGYAWIRFQLWYA